MDLLLDRWTPFDSWALGALVLLLDLVAIGRALLRGHGVESTLAWILAILAFPGVGALAYLLVANPSMRRCVRERRGTPSMVLRRSSDTRVAGAGLLELAEGVTHLPPTRGNRVELLLEDEDAFARIEAALAPGAARRSIWAEYYLVRNDETGQRFLDLLSAAARRGVEVRLLYDAVGSLGLCAGRLQVLREAGGQAHSFLPMNPLRRRWAVHLRNHRKLVVVDGEVAFTGGMNVGDEYSGRARRRGRQHFKDTHLVVKGPAAVDLARVFADDWRFKTDEELPIPGGVHAEPGSGQATIAVLPSGPHQEHNASALAYFTAITLARRTCFVTTPYFVPDDPTVRALVAAAKRGVDVRIVVPAHPDVPLVGLVARASFAPLIAAGVRVFEFLPSMLHAKSIVVDGHEAIVGSANVDIRSFQWNFELGVVIQDRSVAEELERRFHDELASSREVTRETLATQSLAQRLVVGCARLLSPLL